MGLILYHIFVSDSMKTSVTRFIPALLFLLAQTSSFAQTAKDFTTNDCSGKSHHLFSELDAGKVVVICFVMPCATCIGPAQAAFTTVQEYETSHPGRVVFYLADDFANTSCGTLTSWANNNGMAGVTAFSHKDVTETPYGTGGMPKTVVLAGFEHKVYFVENGGLNTGNLKNAINTALVLSSFPAIKTKDDIQLNVYPNPARDYLTVHFVIPENSTTTIEIYNLVGIKVKDVAIVADVSGEQSFDIDLNGLSDGIYFLKIKRNEFFHTVKFTVAR